MSVADRIIGRISARRPDRFIGGHDNPYMLRWWIVHSRLFSIYLHNFKRSDDDRALHDHPWINFSILLRGRYVEHTIAAGGINRRQVRRAGNIKLRLASAAHRLELLPGETCWSLFITGPIVRSWGFHCPTRWVHWREFTAGPNGETIGKGCD